MQVRTRWPANAAKEGRKDLRVTVTFRDESLPLPLRIHFLRFTDEELRLVGVELGDIPRDAEAAEAMPELTALTLRNVVERFPRWLELARAHAVPTEDSLASTAGLAAAAKRYKPARLTPDFLRMVAAEYRRHVDEGEPAPISTIAKSHGVTPSAASRWVKSARDKKLLAADDA